MGYFAHGIAKIHVLPVEQSALRPGHKPAGQAYCVDTKG